MPEVELRLCDLPGESEVALDEASTQEKLRTLIDAHYDFVWRSLRRLGVAEGDIDDGVQRVFLIASRKITAIKAGSEPSFLFQTALRVAADIRRTLRRRREVVIEDSGDAADPAPGPEDLVDLRRARVCLDEILDLMSLELRAVFALFEIDQMTLTEIAELLGVPRGTVASRLRRARADFRARARRLAGDTRRRGAR
jgi:RNA polymerase sigma-70 factor (ECF subfamily)